jgi:hypothetical protein
VDGIVIVAVEEADSARLWRFLGKRREEFDEAWVGGGC